MRPVVLTLLMTALALSATPATTLSAEAKTESKSASADSTRPQHFQLSALYMAAPSLTRAEIDPKAMISGPQPAPAAAPTGATTTTAALPPLAPPIAARKEAPVVTQAPKEAAEEVDRGYLTEYNVDWSRWISAQADRWYYTLKFSEEMLGLHFVTVRPAMIQYTCYADGSIRNVILKQSSGVPAYDRLQMETLMASLPAPPFPQGTQRRAITLCQGWESHPRQPGESDFIPGSFGHNFPKERVQQWCAGR